jgi:hypothetical protein
MRGTLSEHRFISHIKARTYSFGIITTGISLAWKQDDACLVMPKSTSLDTGEGYEGAHSEKVGVNTTEHDLVEPYVFGFASIIVGTRV